MNNPNEETQIEQLMKEAPIGQSTPANLQSRLQEMAAKQPVRSPSIWPSRLALIGVGAIAAGVLAISLKPMPASAKTFQKVLDAVGHANTFEFSMVANEKGVQHRFVIAGDGHKVGMRADTGGLMQIEGAKLTIYDPDKNEVTELNFGGIVDPNMIANEVKTGLNQGMKEMDLKKMLEDYATKYGKENIQIGPIEQKYGQSFYQVDLQSPNQPQHVHMIVNADNDLPEQIDIQERGGDGSWDQKAQLQIKFGVDVDQDLADPKFPANAKHTSLDLGNFIKGDFKTDLGNVVKEGMSHAPGLFQSGHSDADSSK